MTPNNTFERTGKYRGCGSGSCPAAQLGRSAAPFEEVWDSIMRPPRPKQEECL
jgi:hypothetical protein